VLFSVYYLIYNYIYDIHNLQQTKRTQI
jgi:hypothetical protein